MPIAQPCIYFLSLSKAVLPEDIGQWSVSINVDSVLFHRAYFNILTENEGFVSDIRSVF